MNKLYHLVLGAALLSGCVSSDKKEVPIEKPSCPPIVEKISVQPKIQKSKRNQIQNLESKVEEEQSQEELSLYSEASEEESSTIEISYQEPITLDYKPKPMNIPNKSKESFSLDLDYKMPSSLYSPHFDLNSVTFSIYPNKEPLQYVSDTQRLRPLTFEEREYRDRDFGMVHGQIMLRTARIIIYELAKDGYDPFIYMNRIIRYVEKVGRRLRKIEQGITSIFQLDLGNFVEDITNPLGPLIDSVENFNKPSSRSQEYKKSYKRKPVIFSGSVELTINRDPIGMRTLDYALNGKIREYGLQFGMVWEW